VRIANSIVLAPFCGPWLIPPFHATSKEGSKLHERVTPVAVQDVDPMGSFIRVHGDSPIAQGAHAPALQQLLLLRPPVHFCLCENHRFDLPWQ